MKKVLLCNLFSCATVDAAEKIGILKIFGQFALASAVASKCVKSQEQEKSSFLANYQMITALAIKEI